MAADVSMCAQIALNLIWRVFYSTITIFVATVSFLNTSLANEDTGLIKQCIVDTCGNMNMARKAWGPESMEAELSEDDLETIDQTIKKHVSKIMEADLELTKLQVEYWDEVFQNSQELEFTEAQRAILVLSVALDLYRNLPSQFLERDSNGYQVLKLEQAREFYLKKASDQHLLYLDFFNVLMKSSAYKIVDTLSVNYKQLLRSFGVNTSQSLSEFSKALESMVKLIERTYGRSLIQPDFQAVLKKQKNNELLSAFEKSLYVAELKKLFLFNELITNDSLKAEVQKLPFNIVTLRKLFGSRLSNLKAILSNKIYSSQQEMVSYCKKQVVDYVAKSPTFSQLADAQYTFDTVLETARTVLPLYFSGATLSKAKSSLIHVSDYFPESRKDVQESLELHFMTRLSYVSNFVHSLKSIRPNQMEILISFFFHLAINDNTDFSMLLPMTETTCDRLEQENFSDNAYPYDSFGSVELGWESVKWPQYGLGVMAHEIGHIIYQAVKGSDEFAVQRQCQVGQHKLIYGGGANKGSPQEDEDWADAFAVSVLNSMKASNSKIDHSDFVCSYIASYLVRSGEVVYQDLNLIEDSSGRHSTGLYRFIQLSTGLGNLAQSCRQIPQIKGKELNACSR